MEYVYIYCQSGKQCRKSSDCSLLFLHCFQIAALLCAGNAVLWSKGLILIPPNYQNGIICYLYLKEFNSIIGCTLIHIVPDIFSSLLSEWQAMQIQARRLVTSRLVWINIDCKNNNSRVWQDKS